MIILVRGKSEIRKWGPKRRKQSPPDSARRQARKKRIEKFTNK